MPASFSLPLRSVRWLAEENKGLLDIATMVLLVEERRPGLIEWHICGDGPVLPAFRDAVASLLSAKIHGWMMPEQLKQVRSDSHVDRPPRRRTSPTRCR